MTYSEAMTASALEHPPEALAIVQQADQLLRHPFNRVDACELHDWDAGDFNMALEMADMERERGIK